MPVGADYELTEGYIRHRYREINGALAQYVSMAPSIPLGHAQVTVGTVVQTLTPPAHTRRMHLRSLGAPINWRDDGVDPTSLMGFPILADEWLLYDSDVVDFRMVRSAAATSDADVRIAYYG